MDCGIGRCFYDHGRMSLLDIGVTRAHWGKKTHGDRPKARVKTKPALGLSARV